MSSCITESGCVDNVYATVFFADSIHNVLWRYVVNSHRTSLTHGLNIRFRILFSFSKNLCCSFFFDLFFVYDFISKLIINFDSKQIVRKWINESCLSSTAWTNYNQINSVFVWIFTRTISRVESIFLVLRFTHFNWFFFLIDSDNCSIK